MSDASPTLEECLRGPEQGALIDSFLETETTISLIEEARKSSLNI